MKLYVGVCPLNYIGGLSTKLFFGVCPLNYIGGLTNKFGNRRLSNELSKKKTFVLETVFHTWKMHV